MIALSYVVIAVEVSNTEVMSVDVLRYIAVFVRVVELQSFSEAGRQLGIAKSAVSKQVSSLERKLGTQLITRTTRKLVLTEAGKTYYEYCKQMLELGAVAENEIKDYQDKPRGTVRIACSPTIAKLYLTPLLGHVSRLYPDLKIDFLVEDRIVNIIEENIDITVRVGWLQDSNLIARKLGESDTVVFTSPSYIEAHGLPTHPRQLAQHEWVGLSLLPSPYTWNFRHCTGKEEAVQVRSKVVTNHVESLLDFVRQGSGISAIAEYSIRDELASGEFVALFEHYQLEQLGIYAVYPKTNAMPLKTQIVLEQLIALFKIKELKKKDIVFC